MGTTDRPFQPGDLVMIRGGQTDRARKLIGLTCEVLGPGENNPIDELYLRPLAPRGDTGNWAQFNYPAEFVILIGPLPENHKPETVRNWLNQP